MTPDKARIIFKSWQEYIEIADKLSKIFIHIPESFLPYQFEVLEEALNIIAKEYFDTGDKKSSQDVQGTMAAFLARHIKDELALESMKNDLSLMLEHPDVKDAKLTRLREGRDSWAKLR